MATLDTALKLLPSFNEEILNSAVYESERFESVARPFTFLESKPLPSNVHTTGVGIRVEDGNFDPDDIVMKIYVYELDDTVLENARKTWEGIPVEVEQLPVQKALPIRAGSGAGGSFGASGLPPYQQKQRPIVGGISISPLGTNDIGTLGCFLRDSNTGDIFALSNNHVIAGMNQLPYGTEIVQPGAEAGTTSKNDIFARLSHVIPLDFPYPGHLSVSNYFDAALARVIDMRLIQTGTMLGIPSYNPSVVARPVSGMRVVMAGRSSGVTYGVISGMGLSPQVDYGTLTTSLVTRFTNSIRVTSLNGLPFSLPGDSGGVIIDTATGYPVAVLFAGDRFKSVAFALEDLCNNFGAWPI